MAPEMSVNVNMDDLFGYHTQWRVEHDTNERGIEVLSYFVTLYVGKNNLTAVTEELEAAQLFSTTTPVELVFNNEPQPGVYEVLIISYENEVDVTVDVLHAIQKRLEHRSSNLILW